MSARLANRLALANALALRARIEQRRLETLLSGGQRVPPGAKLAACLVDFENEVWEGDFGVSELHIPAQTLRKFAECDDGDTQVLKERGKLGVKQIKSRGQEGLVKVFVHVRILLRRCLRVNGERV